MNDFQSRAKGIKESAMNSRFKDRFEEGLAKIENSLHKKGGVKLSEKVYERIGRLKQKYPSIHRFYQIDVQTSETNIVTSLKWTIIPATDPDLNSGIYFLRTSLKEPDETMLWTFYNIIHKSSEPETKAQQIYDDLQYKSTPFIRKKSVVLKTCPISCFPFKTSRLSEFCCKMGL